MEIKSVIEKIETWLFIHQVNSKLKVNKSQQPLEGKGRKLVVAASHHMLSSGGLQVVHLTLKSGQYEIKICQLNQKYIYI